MKLTNYETSKKLGELGFRAEHDYCYDTTDGDNIVYELSRYEGLYYPAYDLETILEALPPRIIIKGSTWHFELEHCEVCYSDALPNDPDFIYVIERGINNLATNAAELLIKLIEDKIITLPKDE